jgi:hypothetical protein
MWFYHVGVSEPSWSPMPRSPMAKYNHKKLIEKNPLHKSKKSLDPQAAERNHNTQTNENIA